MRREQTGRLLDISTFCLRYSDIFSTCHLEMLPCWITHLELSSCQKLEDEPDGVTKTLCTMLKLQTCKIEKLTWLSPEQVQNVLENCKQISCFHFTPRWIRNTDPWCLLYEQKHEVLSGKDFLSLYLRVAFFFQSSHFLEMARRKHHFHWSNRSKNDS